MDVPNAANQWRENDIAIADLDAAVVTVWGVVIVGALAELSDEGRREIMERQGA